MSEKKRRIPRGWRLLAEVALILAVFLAIGAWRAPEAPEGPLPALEGTTLRGDALGLSDYAGEAFILHFWAPWCPVCRMETGTIDGLAEDLPVVTVAMQSDPEAVADHLAEKQAEFPVILDPDGRHARRFGVQGVPASFVVDADGDVRFTTVGYTTGPGLRARLWWARHWDDGGGDADP